MPEMKKPRVLFLTEGKTSPSTRFAVLSHIPYLQKRGIICSIAHRWPEKYALINLPCFNYRPLRIAVYCLFCYPFSLILRLADLWKLHSHDIIFIQRDLDENHVTPWLERLYRRYAKRLVFYFDDALWLSKNHLGKSMEKKIRHIIKMADWVIVSHEYLADYARQFNQSVLIFPLSIDTRGYFPANTCVQNNTPPPQNYNYSRKSSFEREKEFPPSCPSQVPLGGYRVIGDHTNQPEDGACQVTIGWSGGAWNYPHLIELAEVLEEIKKETGVAILIQSGEPPPREIQKIGVQYIPWEKETERNILQRMDIALCPLKDTPWTRGKFSIKLLQYLACGIPVVCSDVGVNRQIILDGQAGFVVKNQQEWRSRLLTLIYDKEKRKQMALAARQRAVKYYSLEEGSDRLTDFFLSLAEEDSKEAIKEKFHSPQISTPHYFLP